MLYKFEIKNLVRRVGSALGCKSGLQLATHYDATLTHPSPAYIHDENLDWKFESISFIEFEAVNSYNKIHKDKIKLQFSYNKSLNNSQ